MLGPSKRELLRVIERERTQHRQELAGLLDRLAHLSEKPWTLPPRPLEPDTPAKQDPLAHYEEV